MIYEFQADDGRILELEYEPGSAPKIGECVEAQGVKWRRIPSIARVDCVDFNTPMKSLPRWHPDARRYDSAGCPVMRSQDEAREWAKKANQREGYDKWQWAQA